MKIAIWDNDKAYSDHQVIFLDADKYSQEDIDEAFRFFAMACYSDEKPFQYGTGEFDWFKGELADLREFVADFEWRIDWEAHHGEEEKYKALLAKLSP